MQRVLLCGLEGSSLRGNDRGEEQRDVVITTRDFVIANPTACQLSTPRTAVASKGREQGCRTGEHGSARCIADFLGEVNWCKSKVADLLQMSDRLDKAVVVHVAPAGTTHPDLRDTVNRGMWEERLKRPPRKTGEMEELRSGIGNRIELPVNTC